MAGMIKDEESQPRAEGSVDSSDPFDGNSQRFTWTRSVAVGQLQTELDETVGPDVRIAMVIPTDSEGHEIAPDDKNPLTVYVTPSSVDLSAVRQVMGAHRPDPYYGMSDDERQNAQLREKIVSEVDLTPEEMQRAFRLLIS